MTASNADILKQLKALADTVKAMSQQKPNKLPPQEIVLINQRHARFFLTEQGWDTFKRLRKKAGNEWREGDADEQIPRNDPCLIETVKTIEHATHCDVRVLRIPGGVKWFIDTAEGIEYVEEAHRAWTAGGVMFQVEAAGGILNAIAGPRGGKP